MKKRRLGSIIVSCCCVLTLVGSIKIISAEEQWHDEYTDVNGKRDFYGNDSKGRRVYSGYARNGEFYLSDGAGAIYIASSVRGVYSGGTTLNLYYVPQLGRELDDRYYDVQEIQTYSPALTLVLGRDCTMYVLPELFDGFRNGRVVPAGEYIVTRRNLYWMEVMLSDGTVGWVMPQYSDSNQYYATNYAYFKEAKPTLSVDNIQGIGIHQMMMPVNEDRRTGIAQAPKYVTIHNTSNTSAGANALSHAMYQINNTRVASWHYTVDQGSIYQSMPINEVAWHAGDGALTGNSSTVAIEICENSDGNYAQSEYNAALLTARILYENKLSSDDVRLHRDWSGKNCAQNIIEGTKGTMGWTRFREVVTQEYARLIATEGDLINPPEPIPPAPTPVPPGTPVARGDVNADGARTAVDYMLIKNHILGRSLLSEVPLATADVNKDGSITASDYMLVKNHILGRTNLDS